MRTLSLWQRALSDSAPTGSFTLRSSRETGQHGQRRMRQEGAMAAGRKEEGPAAPLPPLADPVTLPRGLR
jgi:hypothetical protein